MLKSVVLSSTVLAVLHNDSYFFVREPITERCFRNVNRFVLDIDSQEYDPGAPQT